MFTKEELSFLLELLDKVNVSGLRAKVTVVEIMDKIMKALELQKVKNDDPEG